MLEGYFKNLYKYTTYETGLEIIRKQTLRFSKPSKFNDPLDCYDGLIEVDESYFPKLVSKKFPNASQKEQKKILIKVKQNYKFNKNKVRDLYKEERERIRKFKKQVRHYPQIYLKIQFLVFYSSIFFEVFY